MVGSRGVGRGWWGSKGGWVDRGGGGPRVDG